MRVFRKIVVLLVRKAKVIGKVISKTENILCAIGVGMLFVLMLLGAGDVIGRYVFNRPIMGAQEISQILMAAMVFLGWSYTQAMKANIRVELVISYFSSRVRAITNFATLLLSLVLFSLIVWRSAVIAMQCWKEHRLIETIYITSAPFHFLVSLGAFVLCLEFIIQMIHLIPEMRKKD